MWFLIWAAVVVAACAIIAVAIPLTLHKMGRL